MEKMTTEEKAKAYDEALERARKSLRAASDVGTDIVTFIFPKLAESDDERITRAINNMLPFIPDDAYANNGVTKEQVLAWLKKRKDISKQIDAEVNRRVCDMIREAREKWDSKVDDAIARMDSDKSVEHWQYVGEVDLEKEKEPNILKPHKGDDSNPYDMTVSEAQEYAIKRGFGIPFNDGEVYVDERHMTQTIGNILRWADEHPKEQKPNIELIQKSWYMEGYHDREFNNEPKWIIKTGEGGPRYEENPKYGQHIEEKSAEWVLPEDFEEAVYKVANFISPFDNQEELRKTSHRFAEQLLSLAKKELDKPAEKQDYSGLTELERAIHRGFLCAGIVNVPVNIIKETAQDCLAHLPAEWSEEDEKMLNNIEYILHKDVSYTPPTNLTGSGNAYYTHQTEIAWLKSLRPSWKPSEEQMKALFDAAENAPMEKEGWNYLYELYAELKELQRND